MINKITGTIDEMHDNTVSINNNGISYTVSVPGSLSEYLKNNRKLGDTISLYTIYYIENGVGGSSLTPKLIGFKSQVEREFFEKYTTVKGLGIKTALKSLVISIKQIASAIENGDVKTIKKLPGLGGRTAEKVIAELKGRMVKYALVKEAAENDSKTGKTQDVSVGNAASELENIEEEVTLILSELGYTKTEIQKLLSSVLAQQKEFSGTEEIIQEIFRQQKK